MHIQPRQLIDYLAFASSRRLPMTVRIELFTSIRGHVFSDGWSEWIPATFRYPDKIEFVINEKEFGMDKTQTIQITRNCLIDFDQVEGVGSIKNPDKRVNAEFRIEIPDVL